MPWLHLKIAMTQVSSVSQMPHSMIAVTGRWALLFNQETASSADRIRQKKNDPFRIFLSLSRPARYYAT